MTFRNQEELQLACTYWQSRLRLSEWKVSISIVRHWDMGIDRGGECSWIMDKKHAKIKILASQDTSPNPQTYGLVEDHELVLVHELLHLSYAPFDTLAISDPRNEALEQSIHFISEALLDLDRKVNPDAEWRTP